MTDSSDTPEPDPVGPHPNELRARLRRHLRDARASLDARARAAAAVGVARHLSSLFREFDPASVAGYLAVGGELDVSEALRACRTRDATTLLPVLSGNSLAFSPFDDTSVMRANRFGIDEPVVGERARFAPLDIDIVLVPLVGFDDALNRLGMGGGFYDRSFAARRTGSTTSPLLVGVAYEMQRADSVFPDWWDVPLDIVVTETGVRRRT